MRLLGVLLAGAGAIATVVCVRGTFAERRPRDLGFALAAPLALALAVLGVVLVLTA